MKSSNREFSQLLTYPFYKILNLFITCTIFNSMKVAHAT